jgi:beta-lactamase regulating signal transducer with metallopeptidase domain
MGTFWEIIVSNTLVAATLALGAIALGRLWKNAAASHLLWIAVLLKLFTPPIVTVEEPFAWSALSHAARSDSLDQSALTPSEARAAQTTALPSTNLTNTIPADQTMEAAWNSVTQRALRWFWPLSRLLAEIWIGGACCVALFYAVRIRRFAKLVRTFEPPSPAINSLVAEMASRLALRRVPDARMTSRTVPPLVWSIGIRPRIILPSALFARLTVDAQAAIVAHELVHIRRRDYLVRLLELAATTVFWWHPIVRWATHQLRELEEQCCDARVLQLLPHQPRTYAAALVDTLEFLSEQPRTPVPLPTAIHSAGSLSRRIRMLRHDRTNRLSVVSAALLTAIVSVPLVVGFSADPGGQKQSSEKDQKTAGGRVAVVQGRVTDEAGAFLPDTRVRVAVPATDMRFVDWRTPGVVETKTDPTGEYRLEIPGITKPTTVSLDAMHLGYRRLVGTFMKGGDATKVEISPGETSDASLVLRGPTLYFAGTVVDEKGRPISGAQIAANANTPRASGGVERTSCRADGTFELFNYTPDRFQLNFAAAKGAVVFYHPDYAERKIDDVYTIADKDRETLRIVLPTGHQLGGTVYDTAGKPVPYALVNVYRKFHRKGTLTDANGRFTFRGLDDGVSTVEVRALDIKQKTKLSVAMAHDVADLAVRLEPISLPRDMEKIAVLGMQLTDLTPQLKSAYDVSDRSGALILDPGKAADRFEIGTLAEGYNFWLVGDKNVATVREFVNQLVTEASRQPGPIYRIRIFYSFHSLEFDGTSTQYIKLTQEDLMQLRTVLDQLAPKSP